MTDLAPIVHAYTHGIEEQSGRVWPTLDELAEAHGVDLADLERQDAAEGWSEQRHARRRQERAELRRARLDRNVVQTEQFDDLSLGIARAGMATVAQRFQKAQGQARDALGQPIDPTEITASELYALMSAAEKAQKIGRTALDLPTERIEQADRAEGQVVAWSREVRMLVVRDVAKGLPGPIAKELLRHAKTIESPKELLAVVQSVTQSISREPSHA
jgi:hypothetical protein